MQRPVGDSACGGLQEDGKLTGKIHYVEHGEGGQERADDLELAWGYMILGNRVGYRKGRRMSR